MPTSIANQTVQQLGGPGSVLARQRRDHEELDVLLGRMRSSKGKAQDEAIARVCRLVFTHAFAEESVLWPALRRELPDGEALTVQVEREHQEITEVVAALERSRRDSAERRASGALASLAGAVEWLPPLRRGEDPSTRAGRTEL